MNLLASMKYQRMIPIVVALTLLGACTASSSEKASIYGQMGYYNGPAHFPTTIITLPPMVGGSGTVTVLSNGKIVKTIPVSKSGKFDLRLAPGAYQLVGKPVPPVAALGAPCLPVKISLQAGEVTSVRINCWH